MSGLQRHGPTLKTQLTSSMVEANSRLHRNDRSAPLWMRVLCPRAQFISTMRRLSASKGMEGAIDILVVQLTSCLCHHQECSCIGRARQRVCSTTGRTNRCLNSPMAKVYGHSLHLPITRRGERSMGEVMLPDLRSHPLSLICRQGEPAMGKAALHQGKAITNQGQANIHRE